MAISPRSQFETVAIPKRLQLVAAPGWRSASVAEDAQLVNCFAERDSNDGEYWINKRPGFSNELLSPASSGVNPGRGLYRFQGYSGGSSAYIFLVVKNARLSRLNQGVTTTTLIGNIVTNQANYTFETIRTSPDYTAVFNDGGIAYYTDGATITDMTGLANFPTGTVRGWAYLDGTLYVMTGENEIYGSANLDDPAVWDPLNVIIARNGSDRSVALAKHKEYVAALKERSTEFFYNAGNPSGSPLSSLRGSKIPYGCANAYTVQEIDEELLWLSRNESGLYQIVRLTDLRPRVISTPDLERVLRTFAGFVGGSIALVTSFQLKVAGHRFYGISGPFSAFGYSSRFLTFVYDLDQNLWYRWTEAATDSSFPLFVGWPVNAAVGPDDSGRVIMQNYTTGNIHSIAEDYVFSSDAGVVPAVDIYTPDHDFGTQRTKQLGAMFFRGNRETGSTLKMRWTDDDFTTWSNFREVDLGATRPRVTDCGSFHRRAWNLRHQSNTSMRIKTFDLQLDIGQN